MAVNYYKPHEVNKKTGDPRLGGPYLDDIRAAQEEARREGRRKRTEKTTQAQHNADVEKKADAKIKKLNKRAPKEYDDNKQRPVVDELKGKDA